MDEYDFLLDIETLIRIETHFCNWLRRFSPKTDITRVATLLV